MRLPRIVFALVIGLGAAVTGTTAAHAAGGATLIGPFTPVSATQPFNVVMSYSKSGGGNRTDCGGDKVNLLWDNGVIETQSSGARFGGCAATFRVSATTVHRTPGRHVIEGVVTTANGVHATATVTVTGTAQSPTPKPATPSAVDVAASSVPGPTDTAGDPTAPAGTQASSDPGTLTVTGSPPSSGFSWVYVGGGSLVVVGAALFGVMALLHRRENEAEPDTDLDD